jgi:hypothetical protein
VKDASIFRIARFVVASLLIFGATHASSAATQIQCRTDLHADSKSPTTLYGTIHAEGHWGPPNFGEHPAMDSWLVLWVLELDSRVSIMIGPGPVGETHRVREVQLLSSEVPIEQFDGAHVRVEGTLEEATAHAATDVVLFTTAISKVLRAEAPSC